MGEKVHSREENSPDHKLRTQKIILSVKRGIYINCDDNQ